MRGELIANEQTTFRDAALTKHPGGFVFGIEHQLIILSNRTITTLFVGGHLEVAVAQAVALNERPSRKRAKSASIPSNPSEGEQVSSQAGVDTLHWKFADV